MVLSTFTMYLKGKRSTTLLLYYSLILLVSFLFYTKSPITWAFISKMSLKKTVGCRIIGKLSLPPETKRFQVKMPKPKLESQNSYCAMQYNQLFIQSHNSNDTFFSFDFLRWKFWGMLTKHYIQSYVRTCFDSLSELSGSQNQWMNYSIQKCLTIKRHDTGTLQFLCL